MRSRRQALTSAACSARSGPCSPLLGRQEFDLTAYTAGLSFILASASPKSAANYVAGTWSDRFGRKPVLVAGWLFAVPVPFTLLWARRGLGRPRQRSAGHYRYARRI